MSYAGGLAALNLEMPPRVPRTEYSAECHWRLVNAVTGAAVGQDSSQGVKAGAQRDFMCRWDYGMVWSTLVSDQYFGACKTNMGHAVYVEGGTDYDDRIRCPFQSPEEVLAFDPWQAYGRIDAARMKLDFEAAYKGNCGFFGDAVNMTGIYTTCISGLISIFGWEMLLTAAGTDPAGFGLVVDRYASWMQQFFDALGEADVPVVMVHDDIVWTSGPFIHPDWYRRYVFPHYRKYFKPLHDSGKKILFTSDGNYTAFIDDIAACGVSGFVLEPTTDMAYIAEKYGRTHAFVGNADTRVLLSGSREQIRAEVQRCMGIGRGCPGFIMAVGNHIPANTPVESALYYNEVYEELRRR